jgi:hypothetical protein
MGKLLIGDVEPASLGAIDKLYVGSELVWPTAQPPGEFLLSTNMFLASGFDTVLSFFGPTAFFGRTITGSLDPNVGEILENTHPYAWSLVAPAMFIRVDIESQSLNGGLFRILANGVNYAPGAWVQINPTSNSLELRGSAPSVIGNFSNTVARVRISDTPNGGNILYDAYSEMRIRRGF